MNFSEKNKNLRKQLRKVLNRYYQIGDKLFHRGSQTLFSDHIENHPTEFKAALIVFHRNLHLFARSFESPQLTKRMISYFEKNADRDLKHTEKLIDQLGWLFMLDKVAIVNAVLSHLENGRLPLAEKYLVLALSPQHSLVDILLDLETSQNLFDAKIVSLTPNLSHETISDLLSLKQKNHPLALHVKEIVLNCSSLNPLDLNLIHFAIHGSDFDQNLILGILQKSPLIYSHEENILLQIIQIGNFNLIRKFQYLDNSLLSKLTRKNYSVVKDQRILEQLLDIKKLCSIKNLPIPVQHVLDFCVELANHDTAEAEETLAQFITILDQDMNSIPTLMLGKTWKARKTAIDRCFKKITLAAFVDFDDTYAVKYPIYKHRFENAVEAALGMGLAKLLCADGDIINLGIIPILINPKSNLCNYWNQTESFLPHIKDFFTKLETDQSMIDLLNQVKAPKEKDSPLSIYLKQSFGNKKSELTDVETKILVLSALLFRVRQREVGSCFATSIAIQIQKNYPNRMLKDLIELISTGGLVRKISGQEIKYPCVFSDLILSQNRIVENPLSKMWEFTISSFNDHKDYLLDNLLTSPFLFVRKSVNKFITAPNSENLELEITKIISEKIKRHLTYFFDPNKLVNEMKDQQSERGAWKLHYQPHEHDEWISIDSFEKTVVIMLYLFKELANDKTSEHHIFFEQFYNRLKHNDKLLRKLTQAMNLKYKGKNADQILKSENDANNKIWINPQGAGRSEKISKAYFESESRCIEIPIKTNSREEWFEFCLELNESLPKFSNQNVINSIGIGGHATSLMNSHPTLLQFSKTSDKEKMIQAGKKYSEKLFYNPRDYIDCINEKKLSDDERLRLYYLSRLMAKNNSDLTISQYFKIFPLLVECATGNFNKVSGALESMDSYMATWNKDFSVVHLIDSNWERDPIHNFIFAGTEGVANIDFAFAYSLFYGQISLYRSDTDGKNLKSLNGDQWFNRNIHFHLNFG